MPRTGSLKSDIEWLYTCGQSWELPKSLQPIYQEIFRDSLMGLNIASKDSITKEAIIAAMVSRAAKIPNLEDLPKKPPKTNKKAVGAALSPIIKHLEEIREDIHMEGYKHLVVESLKLLKHLSSELKRPEHKTRPLPRVCYLDLDPRIGPTTCACDENDDSNNSRCRIIRANNGCFCRSDCEYYGHNPHEKKM